MATLKVTISAKLDDADVPGFPATYTATVDESQLFNYEEPADNNSTTFSVVPGEQIATLQHLLLKASAAATVRLDGQTDAGIQLGADGILVVLGATIDAGAGASNASVNNPAASAAATLKGGTFGT